MIIDPLDYFRRVGDDDREFLKVMKNIEKKLDFVTIKTDSLEIKATKPEKYADMDGDFIFSVVTTKNINISPSMGEVMSKEGDKITIKAHGYNNYQTIKENL